MKKCDICGKEFNGPGFIIGHIKDNPFYLDFKIKKIRRHLNFPKEVTKIHLCNCCTLKLSQWIGIGEKDEIH